MKLRVSEAQLDWTRESQELSDVEQLDVQRAVMLSMYQSLILQRFCQLGIHTNYWGKKAYNPYRRPRLLSTYCSHRN